MESRMDSLAALYPSEAARLKWWLPLLSILFVLGQVSDETRTTCRRRLSFVVWKITQTLISFDFEVYINIDILGFKVRSSKYRL